MSPAAVRRISSPEDFDALVTTLSAAFQNEEAWSYIVPDPEARRKAMRRVFTIMVANDFRNGSLYSTAQNEAVTLWRSPGSIKGTSADFLRNLLPFIAALGLNIGRALRVSHLIETHYPSEAVHYLHFAGCHPDHQGRGFGGAVIRAGLGQSDRERTPAYLETATPGNVSLYSRLGFEVVAEWDVAPELHFWGMLRRPY